MKRPLPFVLLLLSIQLASQHSFSQQAEAFYNKAMPVIKPSYKNLVLQTAQQLKGRRINADSLHSTLKANNLLKGLGNMDIDALMTLIMFQTNKDAEQDLKGMMASIQADNKKKKALRDENSTLKSQQGRLDSINKAKLRAKNDKGKDQKDGMSDMSQQYQFKMQKLMVQRNQLQSMISNLMKKIGDVQQQTISNLK